MEYRGWANVGDGVGNSASNNNTNSQAAGLAVSSDENIIVDEMGRPIGVCVSASEEGEYDDEMNVEEGAGGEELIEGDSVPHTNLNDTQQQAYSASSSSSHGVSRKPNANSSNQHLSPSLSLFSSSSSASQFSSSHYNNNNYRTRNRSLSPPRIRTSSQLLQVPIYGNSNNNSGSYPYLQRNNGSFVSTTHSTWSASSMHGSGRSGSPSPRIITGSPSLPRSVRSVASANGVSSSTISAGVGALISNAQQQQQQQQPFRIVVQKMGESGEWHDDAIATSPKIPTAVSSPPSTLLQASGSTSSTGLLLPDNTKLRRPSVKSNAPSQHSVRFKLPGDHGEEEVDLYDTAAASSGAEVAPSLPQFVFSAPVPSSSELPASVSSMFLTDHSNVMRCSSPDNVSILSSNTSSKELSPSAVGEEDGKIPLLRNQQHLQSIVPLPPTSLSNTSSTDVLPQPRPQPPPSSIQLDILPPPFALHILPPTSDINTGEEIMEFNSNLEMNAGYLIQESGTAAEEIVYAAGGGNSTTPAIFITTPDQTRHIGLVLPEDSVIIGDDIQARTNSPPMIGVPSTTSNNLVVQETFEKVSATTSRSRITPLEQVFLEATPLVDDEEFRNSVFRLRRGFKYDPNAAAAHDEQYHQHTMDGSGGLSLFSLSKKRGKSVTGASVAAASMDGGDAPSSSGDEHAAGENTIPRFADEPYLIEDVPDPEMEDTLYRQRKRSLQRNIMMYGLNFETENTASSTLDRSDGNTNPQQSQHSAERLDQFKRRFHSKIKKWERDVAKHFSLGGVAAGGSSSADEMELGFADPNSHTIQSSYANYNNAAFDRDSSIIIRGEGSQKQLLHQQQQPGFHAHHISYNHHNTIDSISSLNVLPNSFTIRRPSLNPLSAIFSFDFRPPPPPAVVASTSLPRSPSSDHAPLPPPSHVSASGKSPSFILGSPLSPSSTIDSHGQGPSSKSRLPSVNLATASSSLDRRLVKSGYSSALGVPIYSRSSSIESHQLLSATPASIVFTKPGDSTSMLRPGPSSTNAEDTVSSFKDYRKRPGRSLLRNKFSQSEAQDFSILESSSELLVLPRASDHGPMEGGSEDILSSAAEQEAASNMLSPSSILLIGSGNSKNRTSSDGSRKSSASPPSDEGGHVYNNTTNDQAFSNFLASAAIKRRASPAGLSMIADDYTNNDNLLTLPQHQFTTHSAAPSSYASSEISFSKLERINVNFFRTMTLPANAEYVGVSFRSLPRWITRLVKGRDVALCCLLITVFGVISSIANIIQSSSSSSTGN